MSVKSSSSNDLSQDSLDVDWKEKKATKDTDTILVPFYEKDVLVKIEKSQMKIINRKQTKTKAAKDNKKEETEVKSYLVNKNTNKLRKPSYLEAFRRKFPPDFPQSNKNVEEIRSISPEFGDTERDSISDNETNLNHDFFETEAYNDIYYEKIMNQEIADAINNPFNEYIINNLKSVSELTQPRRRSRRASVGPIRNIRLGGLGPDLENIKPRLERAKSLQRYSEKVRMENRLKIYKKSVQDDTNKSNKDFQGKQKIYSTDATVQKDNEPTYLVNKSLQGRKSSHKKSKSACARNGRSDDNQIESHDPDQIHKDQRSFYKKELIVHGTSAPKIIRNSFKESKKKQSKIDLDRKTNEVRERINKTPNYDALKSLEEKHRMYQEKVKQFQMYHPPD